MLLSLYVAAGLCPNKRPSCVLTIHKAKINLTPNGPRLESDFENSMHKTFTDCFLAEGFTDGGWSYALNSNDSDGVELSAEEVVLEEKERRLAYYPLGWDSLEVIFHNAPTLLLRD